VIIRIQQDGASAHITPDDDTFNAGLVDLQVHNKILLYTQPACSPDTKINDLGFFSALQASYNGLPNTPNNESEIIQYVHLAYQEYDSAKINRIGLTLMAVLNPIIEHHGGNDFRLPHLKKGVLDVAGQLPNSLTVTAAALEYLDGNN
jgi:hypothetical protein